MKIESGRSVSASGKAPRAGQAAAGGFAPAAEASQRTAPATPASAVASLDAILALQGDGAPPRERWARQVKRGRAVLDELDELVRALAMGGASSGLRQRLEALRPGGEATGEASLDGLMLEIDTRLEVELAKLDMAEGRA